MKNRKFGILVIIALLSLSNTVLADDNINFDFGQDTAIEKIKANKDTLSKAQEAMSAKDYQTAINLLNAYINEKPKKYEAYKLRGDAYYALRRYYMAQKDYKTAVDIKLSDDKLMTNTKYVSAIVLGADKNEQLQNAELGDLYGALMYAQKAMNDPNYTTSYDNAVKYNSHIYLPQPNKNDINKINCPQKYGKILNPQGIDIKIYGAIDDISNGNYNESLYKLQDVTAQYPNYYLGHYLTGVALSELEKDDDAIKSFEKAITLNPYDFESRASLGRIYYSKAETTFSEDAARKSIEYFNQAIKQNKNCPTYYFYLGMNELQIGNTNVAISNFDKALQINPSDYNSMYYKLIAQYINGNYQDVVDGASKLLLKHVSNQNSVLYLRALAYTKLNNLDSALQDLNTIENNIGDIYNNDIKTTSAREKSLESYVHYLKGQIQHAKGAGSAEDNNIALANPIINRLSNAQKAMEPYEKSLQGDTVALSDYNKFESFYSTSLPKLLESGAVITYEDIDNQYDYIRTTFADLGISFLYQNPNYKMTTIKDYPYKKYSSKLNKGEQASFSARPVSDMTNVALAQAQGTAMRKSTPASELIVQDGQSSLAQMLASNALTGKPKPVEIKEPIVLRNTSADSIAKPYFQPETPDAERIDTSKNIASGEIYESNKPAINSDNTKRVNDIINEEKAIETVPKNIETAKDGSVKIAVKNPVQTSDIVIRNTSESASVQPITYTTQQKVQEVTDTTTQTLKSAAEAFEPMKFHAENIQPSEDFIIRYPKTEPVQTAVQTANAAADTVNEAVKDTVTTVENTKLSAKEAKKLAKEQAKAEKQAAKEAKKLAKYEAKQKLKEEKETLELAQNNAQEQLQNEIQSAEEQIAQKRDSMREDVQEITNAGENVIAQAQETPREIVEKHANIDSDININKPSNSLRIDDVNDIVELDTSSMGKKFGNESDLFDSNTIFAKSQQEISDLTPPVTLPEEPPVLNQPEQSPVQETVPVVDVPEITTPEIRTPEEKIVQNTAPEQVFEPQSEPEKIYGSKDELVKEQLSQIISQVMPKPNTETASDVEPETVTSTDVAATISETEAIKAQRLKLKEDAKFAKAQKKALARKEKEQEKLRKQTEQLALEAERERIKEQEKLQKLAEKEKFALARQEMKQQKAFEKEEAKLEHQQAKLAQTETYGAEPATKSWLNKVLNKDEKPSAETEVIKTKNVEKAQKPEKTAQQIRAEQSRQARKLEKEKLKQQKTLAQEQAKILEQNDETKIQRLKAKLTAMRGSVSDAEKKAQKEQLKAERAAAKQEYKARQLAKKSTENIVSEEEIFLKEQAAQQKAVEKAQKEQQKAIEKAAKEQLKAERASARQEQKIRQQEQKAVEKAQKQQLKAMKEAQIQEQNKQIVNDIVMNEQQKAEQKAIKEAQKLQLKEQKAFEKAQKEQQKAEQKAIEYARKMEEKDRKAHEKAVSYYGKSNESFFSKLKFWKKKQ